MSSPLASAVYFPSIALLLALAVATDCAGQEGPQTDLEQRAAHLAQMKSLAASIKILAATGQEDSAATLAVEPVLRYTDNTRQLDESALWIWTAGKRPAAIAAIEFYRSNPPEKRWLFEVASLSTQRIAAERGSDLKWTATEPGLTFQIVPNADAPTDKPVRRLSQMKALHRRFTAHEVEGTDGRIELRPLTSPLYRYADQPGGVLDGAIFSFVNGTNPEVLLVLEAGKTEEQPPAWRYGLAGMTGGAIVVRLDGETVWSRDEANPPAIRGNYVNGWIDSDLPLSPPNGGR